MNRIFKLFLHLLLIANGSLFGQTPVADSINPITGKTTIIKYRKFQLGVIGNVNLMRFTEAPEQNHTFYKKSGLGAGIHAQFNLRKNIAFTLNCLYETKNWKIHYNNGSSNNFNTFHSLTFPLLLKFYPAKRRFFLAAGPYLGIIMKKQVVGYGEGTYKYNNVFEVGTAVGIGFNIPIHNRISFIIEARDYWNLNNSKTLAKYSKMTTACFQLGFFYKFGETKQVEIKKIIDSAWIKERKVFVKIFYSPQLTYRRDIGDRTTIAGYNTGLSYLNTYYSSKEEIPKYGNEIGIMFEFVLGKRKSLNTGASFETQGFQTKNNIIAVNYGWGDIIGNWSYTTYNNYYNHSFYFISVPLTLNYVIKEKKKRKLYFGLGAEQKYLFRYRLNNSTNYMDKSLLLSSTIFYTANIGISFQVGKNRHLFIEPNVKIQNASIKMRDKTLQLLSAGCKIGVKF